ncbi:MAG: hypothetical protein ACYTEL_00905 [Planctomycetota bacterium]|jgi:hypothetical protein
MNKTRCIGVLVVAFSLFVWSDLVYGADRFGVCGLKYGAVKLRTACEMVREADIGWYRGVIRWNQIVDNEGNFDWQTLDKQVKIILNRRINIIFTFRSVHELFAPGSGKIDLGHKKVWRSAPPAPEYLELYKDFVRQVVERYDGDGFSDAVFATDRKSVQHWQIEVEPGKKPDKGSNYWNGTAADYADLYIVAYDVIKEADLSANVALAAFTWGAMIYYAEHGDSFLREVLRILDEKGGDFDIFDFHFYKDYWKFRRINDAIYDQLNEFTQFSEKPLWVTETSVDKKTLDPYYTTEEHNRFVAKDIVKRCVILNGKFVKVFWFNFSDKKNATWNVPMDPSDFEKFRGLTESSFTPKPVYYTYKLLIQKLGEKKHVRRMRQLQVNDYMWVYKFGMSHTAVYVMWYDSPDGTSGDVQVPLPWAEVLITHVITEPGVTEPVTEVKPTVDGILHITLGDSPIFVEKYPDISSP